MFVDRMSANMTPRLEAWCREAGLESFTQDEAVEMLLLKVQRYEEALLEIVDRERRVWASPLMNMKACMFSKSWAPLRGKH
jgi:hypothetical protein